MAINKFSSNQLLSLTMLEIFLLPMILGNLFFIQSDNVSNEGFLFHRNISVKFLSQLK